MPGYQGKRVSDMAGIIRNKKKFVFVPTDFSAEFRAEDDPDEKADRPIQKKNQQDNEPAFLSPHLGIPVDPDQASDKEPQKSDDEESGQHD
jgi:hypothetical protein